MRRILLHFKSWLKLALQATKRQPDYIYKTDRYAYQNEFNPFNIKPGSSVLDIGSGHYPFPLATVLVDLYAEKSPHRCEPLLRDHRPLIVAGIEELPFKSKSFDFVYCSHVLEHVEDPIRACEEIMRVGKRGYIETPSFGKDVLFGWAGETGHKWFTVSIGNILVFFEYSERQKEGVRSSAWKELIFAQYSHPLQEAFWKNQDVFNSMLTWEDYFKVFVFKRNGDILQL